MFDAIVTDPPYYDNIFYTVLADNFYAWKRMLLKHVEPELFKNESTNFENELVASTQRKGSKAHKDYCINLDTAIKEASRVLKDDGTMSFVYSHRSILGWLGEDIAIGLMAQAVALVSNAIRIENTDDKKALLEVEKLIAKKFPKFTLSKRKSL